MQITVDQSAASEIEIQPVSGPVELTIQPPGSKSITNRALLCAAFADGDSRLSNVLDSDDTRVMIGCLRDLGIAVSDIDTQSTVTVCGCAGVLPNVNAKLFVKNSGTTIRFLTAALGVHGGSYLLSGIDRMHQRPIEPLAVALQQLGASVNTQSDNGCPPVLISGAAASGCETEIAGDVSSQYLSGLMMASVLLPGDAVIRLLGELVSKPYVEMTRSVMQSFGIDAELHLDSQPAEFRIAGADNYQAAVYDIEPDASAASYFWAAAAICGGTVTVNGLSKNSLQGDVGFVECLAAMGCDVTYRDDSITVVGPAKTGIDIDMSNISDTVQTLAAVALYVEGPTTIRGVAHNRVKETDRIGDLITELRRLGAGAEELSDGLRISPGELHAATIETYDDHRMAMSLALVGLKQAGVTIKDPGCTAKTYPGFFTDLARLYG